MYLEHESSSNGVSSYSYDVKYAENPLLEPFPFILDLNFILMHPSLEYILCGNVFIFDEQKDVSSLYVRQLRIK